MKIDNNINPRKKTAPGQSRLHYSPGIPLRMNVIKPKKYEAYILLNKKKIVSSKENYAAWYLDVVKEGDLYVNSPTAGCMTFLPKSVLGTQGTTTTSLGLLLLLFLLLFSFLLMVINLILRFYF